ncbi:MAG: ABC transporter permease [Cyclonatronaceae bacterium]
MRILRIIVMKEFLQIFRNRMMLPIIFVMPFVQLILLSYAATLEIRNIDLYVVDYDQSPDSRELIDHFRAAGRFRIVGYSMNSQDATDALIRNEAKMALYIPRQFGRDLVRTGAGPGSGTGAGAGTGSGSSRQATAGAPVQVVLDAVDGYTAGIAWQYAVAIIGQFNESLQPAGLATGSSAGLADGSVTGSSAGSSTGPASGGVDRPPRIAVEYSHWYNPELDFKLYMVPGILVLLVTMIGGFLSGMNIVREREIGTMEQINVTPVRKSQFIAGKLMPFWILGLVELSFGLVVAWLLFDVPMTGSLGLIYVAAGIYLMGILGLGLLVSTITDTQQQAMFITWFFFVVFILLSGLFTPIDSMPGWAQKITWFNPVAWFIDIMRRVLLAGAGAADIAGPLLVLVMFAAGMILLSVRRYRKSTA